MRDLIKTFLETSKERIKNPFLSAFIISWLVLNWKPIFITLFSNKNIEEKIDYIGITYSTAKYNFWLPLLFSFFYIILLPYLMWLFEKLSNKALRGRKVNITNEKIFDIKAKQELAKEESNLESIRADYKNKADLNKQIEELKIKLEKSSDRIEVMTLEFDELNDEKKLLSNALRQYGEVLTPTEKKKYLNEFEKFKKKSIFKYFEPILSSINRNNSIPNSIDDIIIEKYKANDIIKRVIDEENQQIYHNLTSKGKVFWKDYVLNLELINDEDLPF